jgi:hypothetical protein
MSCPSGLTQTRFTRDHDNLETSRRKAAVVFLIEMFAPLILFALYLLCVFGALWVFPGLLLALVCGVIAIPPLLLLGYLCQTAPPSRHSAYRIVAYLLFAVYAVMIALSIWDDDDLCLQSLLPLTVATIFWTKTKGKYSPGPKARRGSNRLRDANGRFMAKSANVPAAAGSTTMS